MKGMSSVSWKTEDRKDRKHRIILMKLSVMTNPSLEVRQSISYLHRSVSVWLCEAKVDESHHR